MEYDELTVFEWHETTDGRKVYVKGKYRINAGAVQKCGAYCCDSEELDAKRYELPLEQFVK